MMDINKPEDPRAKSNRYSKGARAKFDKDQFDFAYTQFLIDDNYVGDPPNVQVSIDNLNDNIDENFLKKELTKLGKIRTLEIIRHPRTGQHLGLAKVQFEEITVAQTCVENFHGKHIMGRQLNVFKDLRFAIIEKIKEAKLNPRPPPITKPPLSTPILPSPGLPNTSIHHSHLNPQQSALPIHHAHLHKTNSTGIVPSPLSLDYPVTTPGSLTSSAATPEPTSRQRLEDRIAILLKQPNCMLSSIVAPVPVQASPTYSAFNVSDTSYDYPNGSHHHPQPNSSLKMLDKRRPEINDFRRVENNNHSNHYQNHKEPYNRFDRDDKPDRQHENNSEDDWNKVPEKTSQPLDIELTERQIESEVLPHCYNEFYRELSQNLLATIFKKLRENYGYQCLEKAQNAYKARQDKLKVQKDKERIENELQKQFERRYMSKARVERPTEAPRPRVNLIRQRTSDYNSMHETKRRGEADLRRVNRSSAYVAEPERRGSHNTSIDSDFSDSESSSSGMSSSSSSSSRSSSPSSSSSRSSSPSSRSVSSFSRSSDDSTRISPDISRASRHEVKPHKSLADGSKIPKVVRDKSKAESSEITTNSETKNDEQIAISALLCMAGETGDNKQASEIDDPMKGASALEDDEDEVVKRRSKLATKKRKKKSAEVLGVASEYRAAKRFASDPTRALVSYDENMENASNFENLFEEKPEPRFMFPERSPSEKIRMLNDLYGTLNEEDLKYLSKVHHNEGYNKNQDVEIPFGSEAANKAHLNLRKQMIEGKAAEGHPKWWRGCSRCDVIEVSEKEKKDNEEMNYEDLTRAPIKSHVIQVEKQANSNRRDLRGDQRRIAVLNADLNTELIRMYTTSTLQVIYRTAFPMLV